MTRKRLASMLVVFSLFSFVSTQPAQAGFFGKLLDSMFEICGGGNKSGGGGGGCSTSQGPTSKGCWPTKDGTSSGGDAAGITLVVGIVGTTVVGAIWLFGRLFLRKSAKAEDYLEKNKNFFYADAARGEGEYLRGYANIYGCSSPEASKNFSLFVHDQFKQMVDVETLDGKSFNARLLQALEQNPALWLTCDA